MSVSVSASACVFTAADDELPSRVEQPAELHTRHRSPTKLRRPRLPIRVRRRLLTTLLILAPLPLLIRAASGEGGVCGEGEGGDCVGGRGVQQPARTCARFVLYERASVFVVSI